MTPVVDLAQPAGRHARRCAAAGRGTGAATAAQPAAPQRRARPRDGRPDSLDAAASRGSAAPTSRPRWGSARALTAAARSGRFRDHRHGVVHHRRARRAATSLELQADAELGKDRNAVVRVMISDRPKARPRDAIQRVIFGDPQSAGYETFRASIAEYVALAAAELARRGQSGRQGSRCRRRSTTPTTAPSTTRS